MRDPCEKKKAREKCYERDSKNIYKSAWNK